MYVCLPMCFHSSFEHKTNVYLIMWVIVSAEIFVRSLINALFLYRDSLLKKNCRENKNN